MQQTYAVYSDSINNLLESFTDCSNGDILLPVVESLLVELTELSSSREQRYRTLLSQLSSHVAEQNYVSGKAKKMLLWLEKLTVSPVDISALESLIKNLQIEASVASPVTESFAGRLRVNAPVFMSAPLL